MALAGEPVTSVMTEPSTYRMQFRYSRVQEVDRRQDGPIFYSNLQKLMMERMLHPREIMIVSFERPVINPHPIWSDPELSGMIQRDCKVVRIDLNVQEFEWSQFYLLFEKSCKPNRWQPSIYVFGPGYTHPTYVYNTRMPTAAELCQNIKTLVQEAPKPVIAPEDQKGTEIESVVDEWIHRPKVKPKEPEAKPTPAPKPVPVEKKAAVEEVAQIPVRMIGPDGKQSLRSFDTTENVVAVRVWVSKVIGQPHTNYKLFIHPGNTELPLNDTILLQKYLPNLTVRVVLNNAPIPKPKQTSGLWSAIRNFFSDLSFIGDAGGDPLDFWRTRAPVAGPGQPQQQQQQNRVHVVRGRDGINRFKFDKDVDHDRNEYDNGNGNTFQ